MIGKGMMIWQLVACAGASMKNLAQRAKEAGMSWVAIKVVDGTGLFKDNLALLGKAITFLEAAGIEVYGWGYARGADWFRRTVAAAEALAAVQAIRTYHLAGYLIDAEGEYKRWGSASWAAQYMTVLKTSLPANYPTGLCSYRYPSLHPELPWKEFLAGCSFHAPQVYWMSAHNPGYQLERSVRELQALKNMPVIPIGSAFHENGWTPYVSDLNQFNHQAKALGLGGLGWWSWQHAEQSRSWWQTISGHDWPKPATPPESKPPTLKQRVSRLEEQAILHGWPIDA